MKIGLLQYDVLHDRTANFDKIEQLLSEISADIVILPELCAVGYVHNAASLLEGSEEIPDGPTTLFLQKQSRKYECAIIAGVAEKGSNAIYNSAVIVENGNYIGKYRKIHLSEYEKRLFTSGTENEVFCVKNIRIGVQICFDLWFPEISREQLRKGADLFCVLANFGGVTSYEIARVRALENATALALCNRIGVESSPDITADFLGRSTIFDNTGRQLAGGYDRIQIAEEADLTIVREKRNHLCHDIPAEIAVHYESSTIRKFD